MCTLHATCTAAGLYRRHNDFLRFALARALLDYMGWAHFTEDPSCLKLGPGQHVDGCITQLAGDYSCLGVFRGHRRFTCPVLLDVGIVSGGCVSNINNSALNERVHRHIRSAEEKKQEKYGDAAKRRGAHFVPAVFSAQGGWGERYGPKSFTSHGCTMRSSVSNVLLTRGKTSGLFTVECERWQHSWDVRSHDRMAKWLSKL